MSLYPESSLPEAYLRLLSQHERRLVAYVYSLVLNASDAEDILQECRMVMWKRFDTFEKDGNFLAWARKIALYQILNFRRSLNRRPLCFMEEGFIESVAGEIDKQSAHLEKRSEALQHCLKKLPEAQRKLIQWRYFENGGIESIASETGRTEAAIYRALSRVRQLLNGCITKTLKTQTA